ncbi:hypothetical protein HUU53_01370 [Candidatus Micrarchaeota archaeon]|nr:hypothetical protein [Candidatus Micrarchaeota archaeon]
MRVFKHGDSLAIVLPDSVAKAVSARVNDDVDFLEVKPGVFVLVFKESLKKELAPLVPDHQVKPKKTGLLDKGFLVVQDEEKAKELSIQLEPEIKSGNVLGVRGFDKRYYIVSKWFLEQQSPKLYAFMKEKDCRVQEIADFLKISLEAAQSLVFVLKENGELLEKKQGLYKLI